MYATVYRYRVPVARREPFLALQDRVARAYSRAGAVQSLLLAPTDAGDGRWMDVTLFRSAAEAKLAEDYLTTKGNLGELFREFLEITGLREDEIEDSRFEVPLNLQATDVR